MQFEEEEVGERLSRLLEPFLLPRAIPVRGADVFSLARRQGRYAAYRDCRKVADGEGWAPVVAQVLAHLNRSVIDRYTGLAVHASVVADGSEALAFPVGSGGGKTTLAAACLLTGFHYVSDEALCVDPATGRVTPYPKPLALTSWSREALGLDHPALQFPGDGEALLRAEDLGSEAVTDDVRLAHVVLAEYGDDAADLRETSRSEGMAALLRHSFNHFRHGETAFRLAAELAREARVWRLSYRRPDEAASLLRSRLPGG